MGNFRSRPAAALLAGLLVLTLATSPAEARRGGSFGSRGSRTWVAPRATQYGEVGPLQRSMTPRPADAGVAAADPWHNPGYTAPGYAQPRRASRFGGFGGGLVGGLLAGGLMGAMMGHGGGWGMGYGGMGGGFLLSLIQLLLVGGLVWFVVGFFRGRKQAPGNASFYSGSSPWAQAAGMGPANGIAPAPPMTDIAITSADKAAFEQLLSELQDAFGKEDFARLRAITTPEIMSYLSEELSQNATSGRRNEVRATRLLDAEIAEAWSEGAAEYATIAMHYESIDVMRDRSTGQVVSGDPDRPTDTNEVWTFVRSLGGEWRVSAIQT